MWRTGSWASVDRDPGYMAASVMNNALGQYALGGRLGDSIRERQGMAYYVFSSLDAGLGPGAVMVRAGVSAENVARTIASIDQEIALVVGEGFTEKEIAESRQYLVGSLPRQLETNGGIASFLLNAEFYGLGLDYDQRLPALIRGVTRDAADRGRAPAARSRPRDGGRRRARGRTVVTDAGRVRAVFFDVDFTLIYPGPTFQGEGYQRACQAHGIAVDPRRFEDAVKASSFILDEVEEPLYDDGLFIHYTASIIEHMGGRGPEVVKAARDLYQAWAGNHHFELYDDVEPVLPRAAWSRASSSGRSPTATAASTRSWSISRCAG